MSRRRHDLDGVLSLSLLAGVDTVDAVDETLELGELHDGIVERRSTIWERAWLELREVAGGLEVQAVVAGRGTLTTVTVLGGRSALGAGAPLGRAWSGCELPQLFSPSPEDGLAPYRPVGAGAAVGVIGEGEPGRGRWLFSPAPLYWAAGDAASGRWIDISVVSPVDELRFAEVEWDAYAKGFAFRFDYDGQTEVDGEFRSPTLLIRTDVGDPWRGLRSHRSELAARGAAPAVAQRETQEWWHAPIFCGWGAQCWFEKERGGLARDYATQANYDLFLAQLDEHGLQPGTITLDDKWQSTYGRNEPDPAKWPDLPGWIEQRHAAGQRVLLWWKAWDPEGLPPELCIRNADGEPVGFDANNPEACELLRAIVRRMLLDYGADGFKVDFTARTPSGRSLRHTGGRWGIALLHELLRVFYGAAKEAKPEALVITHTPHPAFVDVTDMIRLNDVIGGVDLVEQMEFRAQVVRAACPELPIDTDDWRVPDKHQWREFLAVKKQIGVPSLYYASHIDSTGEPLDDEDYAALKEGWA
jgi:hypothetical protein